MQIKQNASNTLIQNLNMAGFIIFVLLVIIWIMYTNKKDAELREKERLFPGYIEKMEKINRIKNQLGFIEEKQRNKIKKATAKGKKFSFWTHGYPKKQGYYQVQFQETSSESRFDDEDILFYKGVLYPNEWGECHYNDEFVYPKLLTKTAYWDGVRYDVKNVKYYLFEMK